MEASTKIGVENGVAYRVDKQATMLLDISFWSNIVCVGLLIVINAINLTRKDGAINTSILSTEMVIAISAGLSAYMAIQCLRLRATKRRLANVFIKLTDSGVEGVSMANPKDKDDAYPNGRPFSLAYGEITAMKLVEIKITNKHAIKALRFETEQATYVVPAPENAKALLDAIEDRQV